jgi:hypothetical protein
VTLLLKKVKRLLRNSASKFLEIIAFSVDYFSLLGLFKGERSLSFLGELEGGGAVEVKRGVSVFFSKNAINSSHQRGYEFN